MPTLAHDRITAPDTTPERWLLILHGIYGAGRNWASVARRFVRARPEWGCVLVDLRLHGDSRGFEPPHTLEAAAGDVAALVASEGLQADAILGHSFGGKVALLYARDAAPGWVWVVDSTPDARQPDGSAWAMLEVLRRHPGPFADRNAGVAAVESEGYATPVAQWMATNLVDDGGGGLRWRVGADDMEALLRDFFATDAWDVLAHPPEGTRIHLVRAEESSVLTEEAVARAQEAGDRHGQVFVHRVAGGHWVNADNPDALHDLLVDVMG